MIVDALFAVFELFLLPLDTTPSRRTAGWLWALWLIAMALVLGLVGIGIYAVAVTF
jgi:hypothetical protein